MTELITIYTSGYSIRTVDSWVRMIKKHGIELLVDVRSLGKSKETANKPEFSQEALSVILPEKYGIKYFKSVKLGGYKSQEETGITKEESPNHGLCKKNGFSSVAFRHFADYMYANPLFLEGIDELLEMAKVYKTCIFCCEGWERRCHRNMCSDYLTAFDLAKVYHITSGITAKPHERIELGQIYDGKLIYPPVS